MVSSIKEAIEVTMKKYNYSKNQYDVILNAIINGDFSVITSDYGARDYIKKIGIEGIKNQLQTTKTEIDFDDFNYIINEEVKQLRSQTLDSKVVDSLKFNLMQIIYNGAFYKFDDGRKMQYDSLYKLMINAAKEKVKLNMGSVGILPNTNNLNDPNINMAASIELTGKYILSNKEQEMSYLLVNNRAYLNNMLDNLINYAYFDRKNKLDDKKSLHEVLDEMYINDNQKIQVLFEAMENRYNSIDSISKEYGQSLRKISQDEIMRELLLNSFALRKLTDKNINGINEQEIRLYGKSNSTIDDVQNNIIKNNNITNLIMSSGNDKKAIIDNLNTLSIEDKIFLCSTYLNCNKKENRQIISNAKTFTTENYNLAVAESMINTIDQNDVGSINYGRTY